MDAPQTTLALQLTLGFLAGAALLTVSPKEAKARDDNVEHWLNGPAARYVAEQLTTHPRFKRASVRFAVLQNGKPVAVVDELSLRLRDNLERRVIDVPGVTVSSRTADDPTRSTAGCRQDDTQYVIGLEMSVKDSGDARVELRALDNVERTFVSGFSFTWRGRLNRTQQRRWQQRTADRFFLGTRSVPFEQTETDLMAAHLANELRCALMRAVSGDYVVHVADANDQPFADLAELVGNNLGALSSLRRAASAADANAVLRGKAHRVDGALHQYWITLSPEGGAADLSTLSASVYVRLPGQRLSAAPTEAAARSATPLSGSFLGPLRLVRLQSDTACPGTSPGLHRSRYGGDRNACWALRVQAQRDAVVFVLHHQLNNGLVRLGDRRCQRSRTAARVVRASEAINVRVPADLMHSKSTAADRWQLEPDADTYYAIAVSDSKAARTLAERLRSLPQRCSASLRPGYEGAELAAWLDNLSADIERWQAHVSWSAIKIKNVY